MAALVVPRNSGFPSIFPKGYHPLVETTQKVLAIWQGGKLFYPTGEVNKTIDERLKKILRETPLNWANFALIFIDVAGVVYIVVDVWRRVARL